MKKVKALIKGLLVITVFIIILIVISKLPTNGLLIFLSAVQLVSIYLIMRRIKVLEKNQELLGEIQKQSTKNLSENQEVLHSEIKRLQD